MESVTLSPEFRPRLDLRFRSLQHAVSSMVRFYRMNRIIWALGASLALFSFSAAAERQETGFLDRTATVEGVTYRYQVYVPADYTADKKWPVVLFLHGAGERGDDGLAQTKVGIG